MKLSMRVVSMYASGRPSEAFWKAMLRRTMFKVAFGEHLTVSGHQYGVLSRIKEGKLFPPKAVGTRVVFFGGGGATEKNIR